MPNIVYTVSERIEIVLQHEQGLSFRRIADHFAAAYPGRPIPSITTIRNMVQKFRKTGIINANYPKVILPSKRLSDDIKLDICLKVEEDKSKTAVQIAKELHVSKSSVLRVLKEVRSKSSNDKPRSFDSPDDINVKLEPRFQYEELKIKPEPTDTDSSEADEPDPESDPLNLNTESIDIKEICVKMEPFSTEP